MRQIHRPILTDSTVSSNRSAHSERRIPAETIHEIRSETERSQIEALAYAALREDLLRKAIRKFNRKVGENM